MFETPLEGTFLFILPARYTYASLVRSVKKKKQMKATDFFVKL